MKKYRFEEIKLLDQLVVVERSNGQDRPIAIFNIADKDICILLTGKLNDLETQREINNAIFDEGF